MTEEPTEAQRGGGSRLSPVWIVPLVVALIGAWLFYQNIVTRGPVIVLHASTAAGLEAGKTAVNVRSVQVGRVEEVSLTEDYSGAVIEVRMNPGSERLLAEDSRFWVVKPRIGLRGISGLNTILSGAYIQLRPGTSDNMATRFEMREQPPVSPGDVPGLSIELVGRGDAALNIGDPIVYQGQMVGRIETTEYQPKTQEIRYGAFIKKPYDELVTENTQFWNRSGVGFQLTSEGVSVQLGSLEALLSGGLTFGVPTGVAAGAMASHGAKYVLYPSREMAEQDRFDQKSKFVVLFPGSVRGLNAGAPVEFNGIRVGTVTEVPFFRDNFGVEWYNDFRIPVLITFEPQRLGPVNAGRSMPEWKNRMERLIGRGLTASVRLGNLLTGATFVDLDFASPDADQEMKTVDGYPIFPSRSSGIAGLEQKITQTLDKFNDLALGKTVHEFNDTLAASQDTFREMEATLTAVSQILDNDSVRNLPQEMQATLADIRTALATFSEGQPGYDNINQALRRLNTLLEELTPLARTLRQQPEALFFGREQDQDPVPRARP